jgi:hypothetical protein
LTIPKLDQKRETLWNEIESFHGHHIRKEYKMRGEHCIDLSKVLARKVKISAEIGRLLSKLEREIRSSIETFFLESHIHIQDKLRESELFLQPISINQDLVKKLFQALPSEVYEVSSTEEISIYSTPIIFLACNMTPEVAMLFEKRAWECSRQLFTFLKLSNEKQPPIIYCYEDFKVTQVFPLEEFDDFCQYIQELQLHYFGESTIMSSMGTNEINWTELNKGVQLGKGAQGIVFKAEYKGEIVAIKKLFTETDEAKHLSEIDHPNVMPLLGISSNPSDGQAYLVLPYYEGGSLDDCFGKLPEPTEKRLFLILQLANALNAMHQNNKQHGDLSPGNILFTSKELEYASLVIGDLGFTRHSSGVSGGGTQGGTGYYRAPEQGTDLRSDIYSFAELQQKYFWDAGLLVEKKYSSRFNKQVC